MSRNFALMINHVGRASTLTLCLIVSVCLAACAPSVDSKPWFTTPIKWGDANRGPSITTGDPPVISEDAQVTLLDSTHAQLRDFPQGRTVPTGHHYECLKVSSSSRYTGPATWTVHDADHIVLTFSGSSVSVSNDNQRGQDWSTLRFYECKDFPVQEWAFGLICGTTYYGSYGKEPGWGEGPCV